MFSHHGYVFVFKINNSRRFQNLRSRSRTCFMEFGDFKWSRWKFACGLGLRGHVFCVFWIARITTNRQSKQLNIDTNDE